MEIKARVNNNQVKLKYRHKLEIITSKVDVDDEVVNIKRKALSLFHKPIRVSKMTKEDVLLIRYLLDCIAKSMYPTVPMIELGYKLTEDVDNPLTQAILRWCKEDNCLCPLFFSLGCPAFWMERIETERGEIEYNPVSILDKKCIKITLAALRRFLSKEDIDELAIELIANEPPIHGEE